MSAIFRMRTLFNNIQKLFKNEGKDKVNQVNKFGLPLNKYGELCRNVPLKKYKELCRNVPLKKYGELCRNVPLKKYGELCRNVPLN